MCSAHHVTYVVGLLGGKGTVASAARSCCSGGDLRSEVSCGSNPTPTVSNP